jgi:predicted transposase/invertase (TIGR01784 family)
MKQDLRDLEFNFIELKKFNKQEEELDSIIEKWIYFIKNAENLTIIPKSAAEIPELKEAYTLAAMNAWTEEELEIYEYWQIRDAADMYGMEEQFGKGKIEVARNLKLAGVAVDLIIQATCLSKEEIEKI